MTLPDTTVKMIADNCDIVDVVGTYVTLTKKGSSHFGLCPFHPDKNPSMSVSRDKKIFNCFSCGTKGNVISFVSKYENISFEDAAIKLAKKFNLNVDIKVDPEAQKKERLYKAMEEALTFYQFYLNNSEEGKKALEYLKKRGINEDIIRHFQIGLAPSGYNYLHQALNQKEISIIDQIDLGLVKQGQDYYDVFRRRIMFPIKNHYGRTVAFSGRIFEDVDEPKYINSMENPIFHKSEVLYNFHNASSSARQENRIYIFEGFMDVIAGVKAEIYNCVATMGTALTNFHIKELANITKNIILCFDGDTAGITATKRAIPLLISARIQPQTVCLPDDLDPDDYLKKYGKEALVDYLNNKTTSTYEFLYQQAKKSLILEDVKSIDIFRQEVFSFLKLTKNPVVADFYLKKIANDLTISLDTLTTAFGQVPTPLSTTSEVPTVGDKPKKSPVLAKVTKALKGTIKFIMIDKGNIGKYRKEANFMDPDYLNYTNLLQKLLEYYDQYQEFDEEVFFQSLEQDQKLFDTYYEIKNDNLIGIKGDEEFQDYLTILNKYLNGDMPSDVKKQKAIKDAKYVDEYIQHLKKHKRVVIQKEEKNV